MTRAVRFNISRYMAYTLELFLISMLQQTPGLLPQVLGARPVLLIPAVITIAMFESDITGMVFGIAGGLLIDFAAGGLLGFHGLFLAIICFFLGMICNNLIQTNLVTALLVGALCLGIVIFLQWLFFYLLPGYSYPIYALTRHYLPRFIYTLLFVPLMYFFNRAFALMLQAPQK